jgi:hypothetical protein
MLDERHEVTVGGLRRPAVAPGGTCLLTCARKSTVAARRTFDLKRTAFRHPVTTRRGRRDDCSQAGTRSEQLRDVVVYGMLFTCP